MREEKQITHAQELTRTIGLWIITLSGLFLLAGVLARGWTLTTNPRSRIITVERLVDAGTWAHVAPGDTTPFELSIDRVVVGDRSYSSKPPLYPLIMAVQAKLVKKVSGFPFYKHYKDYSRILLILNQVIPYLWMLYLILAFLQRKAEHPWTVWFILLALGPGMLAYAYAATINNHTPAAVLLTLCFLLWERMVYTKQESWWRYCLLGLMGGLAFSFELTGGFVAAWWIILAARRNFPMALLAGVAFLIPVLISLALYHYLSGVWKPFYLQPNLYDYDGSYFRSDYWYSLKETSKLKYFWHMTVGFRGLFSMTPLLLLAIIGWGKFSFWQGKYFRWEFLGVVLGAVALGLFILVRTSNYGGDCIGMRWFICFSPLLILGGLPLFDRMMQTQWKWLCWAAWAWSIPWTINALFEEAFVIGWFENMWF